MENTERIPAEVFPPGEFIREEIEARGWTQHDLATILGKSTNLVSEIINGKRAVTPDTAVALGDAFGTGATVWLNLQNSYDLHRVKRSPDVEKRAKLYEKAPVAEMIKRGWISSSPNLDVLETRILRHFEIASLDQDFDLRYAARKTISSNTPYESTTGAQWAWLFRAKHLAKTLHVVRRWKLEYLDQLKADLRALTVAEAESRRVAQVFSEYGLRFVVVEPLPGTKIDGACIWLDDFSPVIAVSLRHDRIDNFWFTCMHELGHVSEREDSIDVDILAGDECEKPASEIRADNFAANALIDRIEFDDFMNRKGPIYTRSDVRGFANRLRVHPGIVAGQIRRATRNYKLFCEMLVKVRQIVVQGALTDGWGAAPLDLPA